jgi:hypothetical protein
MGASTAFSTTRELATYTPLNDPNEDNFTAAHGISGGNIVGQYNDFSSIDHGFLYNVANQTYTTLDDPDAVGSTYANGISGGNVVGSYQDASQATHGFLYDVANQTYTTFDDPDAGNASYQGTSASGI